MYEMRVITEERLRDIYAKFGSSVLPSQQLYSLVIKELLMECQDIKQLTVTKLRPMSEAPIDEQKQVIQKEFVKFKPMVRWDRHSNWWCAEDDINYDEKELIGWIPSPQYKPPQPSPINCN